MTDNFKPYSYKEWLSLQSGSLSEDTQSLYTEYLKNWYALNNKKSAENKEILRQEYLQLIKDISYLFNTEEKDRFLKNIDYTNPEEIIYAIPYFSKKLKEISKVINAKRNSIKNSKLKYNLIGSDDGLHVLLYEYLLKTFTQNTHSLTQVPASKIKEKFPALSAVKDDFFIEIEELYDTNTYHDSDPSVDITQYADINSFLNEYPFEDLTEDEILNILQTRFLPKAANNPLSLVYQAYLTSIADSNNQNYIDSQTNLFNLKLAATQKYLGETIYSLTAIRLKDLNLPDKKLYITFQKGNNWFMWPSGNKVVNPDITDNYFAPIELNSSNFVNCSATGGSSLENSDLIFTDQNGIVEGAWLRGVRSFSQKVSTSVTIFPDSIREFIYPYVGFEATSKGFNWAGHTINDEMYDYFDVLPSDQKEALMIKYYTESLPTSSSSPIYLNQTKLIEQGALAGNFAIDGDIFIKRKNTQALESAYSDSISGQKTEVAFLYKFQKTDLPISQGINQIYWPIKNFESSENLPITIKYDCCNPVRLGSLKVSETMTGATAGFAFNSSDVIYKLNARTQEPIEAAWLAAASIQNLDLDSGKGLKIYNTDAVKCAKFVDGPIQSSLTFKADALRKVSFIWSDIDTPADDVFHYYKHAPNCKYGKTYPHDYYDDQDYLNPTELDKSTNYWTSCNCKSIYYSPIGHKGNTIVDYNGVTDLLFADPDGLGEDFAINSWSDTRGFNAYQSPQFAFYQLQTDGDSPIGWGKGSWKNGNNTKFILKTGKRYTYYRTSLRRDNTSQATGDDELSPFYIVKYPYQQLRGTCNLSGKCFDLVIALDVSNSQKLALPDTKELVKNISKTLLQRAADQDKKIQIALIVFNKDTTNISYLTKEYGALEFNISAYFPPNYSPEYKTNITNALTLSEYILTNKIPPNLQTEFNIQDLCKDLNNVIVDTRETSQTLNLPQNCPKKILLISDGVDNLSPESTYFVDGVKVNQSSVLNKAKQIKAKNIEIYTVDSGLLSNTNNLLEQIATNQSYYYDLESFLKEGEGDVFSFSQKIAANIVNCTSVVPTWCKAIRGSDGNWTETSDPSDMILRPGDFLIYVHQSSVYYSSEDLGSGFTQDCIGFTINAKLNGWDYKLNKFNSSNIGDIYGGKPFWGTSDIEPNDIDSKTETFFKETNYFGGYVRYFDGYTPIRQPDPSTIVIENGDYIQYFRKANTTLNWIQPITLTHVLSDAQWNTIKFEKEYYHLDDILKNGEFNFYGESTDESSPMRLESFTDFRPAKYNYYARKTFTYEQDLYYLNRCENSFVVFLTGSALEPLEPYANLLNIHYPTIASVNSPKDLVSEKRFGGYLTPLNLGVSHYRGKGYTIEVDPNKFTYFDILSAEKLFFDPLKYAGRNRGLTKKDQIAPTTIKAIDNRWLVEAFNAGEKKGTLIKTQENQKMIPYQTYYEITNKNNSGLSRQDDQIDFWTNESPVIWNDEKNYPLTFKKELQASTFELRKKGLLVDKGKITQWRTDIYGNDMGLFKGSASVSLIPTDFIVGGNSTYVGFGASTGADNNEHWIHDFIWTSAFNSIGMQNILGNSNFIGTATRIGNSIRLTPLNGVGNVFYNIPVFVMDNTNQLIDWSVYFVFSMGGGTRADGISFILQSNNLNSGGGGYGMGYVEIPKSIGICYDSFNNYSYGTNDPNDNHIELDANGSLNPSLAIQPYPGLDLCGTTGTDAYRYNWIDYNASTKQLKVYISSSNQKPSNPVLTYTIDISDYVLTN